MKPVTMVTGILWALAFAAIPGAQGETPGFVETYVLAPDRDAALKQLVPSTDDYYYYHCLRYQAAGDLEKADALLGQWTSPRDEPRRREIQHRQMLLRFATSPESTLEYLRRTLNLTFSHEPERPASDSGLSTRLDAALVSSEVVLKQLLERAERQNSLDGFEPEAYDWLLRQPLSAPLRHEVLQRLTRSDYPKLVEMIVKDMAEPSNTPFGGAPVHSLLTLDQMEELLRLRTGLLNDQTFVSLYIQKLAPRDEVVLDQDAKEKSAYLERVSGFVSRLGDTHNSIKAHVLYHRLELDRKMGKYDRERFIEYLRLPRLAPYVNPDFLAKTSDRPPATLGADFSGITQLATVQNDEPLVRAYLEHFLAKEDISAFQPYLETGYLRRTFASTRLLNGQELSGDYAKWLTPDEFVALRDRVELEFDPANVTETGPDDPVTLELWVKNVPTLIVRSFEMNAAAYFRQQGREINTDIDLDGLAPNHEDVFTYTTPPVQREKKRFDFPHLDKRGVYVIDFIGNGVNSRALIRKGRLQHTVRTGAAGQMLRVYDESGELVKDARAWASGREFPATEDGTIVLPFTAAPAEENVVLMAGEFASLARIMRQSENYRLEAGIHIDRESLVAGMNATVVIRPRLTMNGIPIALSLLKESALTLFSINRDGVPIRQDVKPFSLKEGEESVHTFRVPSGLMSLNVQLAAKVTSLATGNDLNLTTSTDYPLNGIDGMEYTEALHLGRSPNGFTLDLLGKSGEPKTQRPVYLSLKNRYTTEPVEVTLETDQNGRIHLGSLPDITTVAATGPEGASQSWPLTTDAQATVPGLMLATKGDAIRVPHLGPESAPSRERYALFETRRGQMSRDRFDALTVEGGYLTLRDLEPGDYQLILKAFHRTIAIRVTEGVYRDGFILARHGYGAASPDSPLNIAAIDLGQEAVTVRVSNASQATRIHIVATVFVPTRSPAQDLAALQWPDPQVAYASLMTNALVSGRRIGDEYRYVLDRKYAKKYAGAMLERPGLILTPWAVETSETQAESPAPPAAMAAVEAAPAPGAPAPEAPREAPAFGGEYPNLDFLPDDGVVLVNLIPDAEGHVTIPLADLRGRRLLHVLAVDATGAEYRTLALHDRNPSFRDIRLAKSAEPDVHVTELKHVVTLRPGNDWSTLDRSAQVEPFDTVGKVFRVYSALLEQQGVSLRDFEFLARWPALSKEEKCSLYSKFACHEVNFFLYTKDPEFFSAVVRPYIANKLDKQFMDRWLLGEDLSSYSTPFEFERLNAFERILLGARVDAERARVLRHIEDLASLTPPDPDRVNLLMMTALQGGALSANVKGMGGGFGGGGFGVDAFAANGIVAGGQLAGEAFSGAGGLASPGPASASDGDSFQRSSNTSEQRGQERVSERRSRKQAPNALTQGVNGKAELDSASVITEEASRDRDAGYFFLETDANLREDALTLYRAIDQTQELAESNYYRVRPREQGLGHVRANTFWLDYARHTLDQAPSEAFLSRNFLEPTGHLTEALLALAVLDLPFEAGTHAVVQEGARTTLTAASPVIAAIRETAAIDEGASNGSLLVSERFFDPKDAYRFVGNERFDKFVEGEFLSQRVYGCRIVVTNPTSSPQRLDVFQQLPEGSVPVSDSRYERTTPVILLPYNTTALQYFFYFPLPGDFHHYPVQVSSDGTLLASAAATGFKVVEALSSPDTTSWHYVSQHGTSPDVLAFLERENLHRLDLEAMAWRMKERAFYDAALAILSKRHVYNHVLWSYALLHGDIQGIRQYLSHAQEFVQQCGPCLESELLTIDPVERGIYEHLEYAPLVNARQHRLGAHRTILNERLAVQYGKLLQILARRSSYDADDLMSLTYYLLLQDRVEEALTFFTKVNRADLQSALQYDYFATYFAMREENLQAARAMAEPYKDYPVERWRKLFHEVLAQLDEAEGVMVDRERTQDVVAAAEPSLDLKVTAGAGAMPPRVIVEARNATSGYVRYYPMDVESLFSRDPFGRQVAEQFATVRPARTDSFEVHLESGRSEFDLPEEFRTSNVVIEVEAQGVRRTQAYYATRMTVHVIDAYGQIKAVEQASDQPLPRVYVKVAARMKDGSVRFYKDGYTDLRGRFDFATLSTNDLDQVDRFALLVMSENHGAVVLEAAPPRR